MNETHKHKEYQEHTVFGALNIIGKFYNSLSFNVIEFVAQGTSGLLNFDTYVFSSMKGTLESIHDILKRGRINDAYALLRKYHDSVLINVYCNLYLDEHFSIENFVVKQIDNWIKGTEQIPAIRIINNYIQNNTKVKGIYDLLYKDKTYGEIRDRCNDHTHYNYYKNVLLNDNEIHWGNRIKELDQINNDITNLFILHFAYIAYTKDVYLMSSDYTDYLDVGDTPPKDSQYWVAPFMQEIFDSVIKIKRPDIAVEIKAKTMMHLD